MSFIEQVFRNRARMFQRKRVLKWIELQEKGWGE